MTNTSRLMSFLSKKNIAGIKSNSTKGGGGYNEWNFDDTKGSEKIRSARGKGTYELVIRHAEKRTIGETFGKRNVS